VIQFNDLSVISVHFSLIFYGVIEYPVSNALWLLTANIKKKKLQASLCSRGLQTAARPLN